MYITNIATAVFFSALARAAFICHIGISATHTRQTTSKSSILYCDCSVTNDREVDDRFCQDGVNISSELNCHWVFTLMIALPGLCLLNFSVRCLLTILIQPPQQQYIILLPSHPSHSYLPHGLHLSHIINIILFFGTLRRECQCAYFSAAHTP